MPEAIPAPARAQENAPSVFVDKRGKQFLACFRLPFGGPTAPQSYYSKASSHSCVSPRAGLSQRVFAGLIPPQTTLCKPAQGAYMAVAVGLNFSGSLNEEAVLTGPCLIPKGRVSVPELLRR